MARRMENKERLCEPGNFSLEKNPVFIFLNRVIEKMGIDFSETYRLARMRCNCHKPYQGQFQVKTRKKENISHNEVGQTETSNQRCCGMSIIGDFKNLIG